MYFLCAFSSANLAASAPVPVVALPEPEPEAAAEVLPEPEPEPEAALLPASLAEAEEAEDPASEALLDSYDTSSNLIGSYQLLTSLTSYNNDAEANVPASDPLPVPDPVEEVALVLFL